jgi:hypothetical protein
MLFPFCLRPLHGVLVIAFWTSNPFPRQAMSRLSILTSSSHFGCMSDIVGERASPWNLFGRFSSPLLGFRDGLFVIVGLDLWRFLHTDNLLLKLLQLLRVSVCSYPQSLLQMRNLIFEASVSPRAGRLGSLSYCFCASASWGFQFGYLVVF